MRPRSTSNETLSSATIPPKRTPTFWTRSRAPASAIPISLLREVLKISAEVYDVSGKAGSEEGGPGDPLDHAARAAVHQPAGGTGGEALSRGRDRQPAAGQIAAPASLRGFPSPHAAPCRSAAGRRAEEGRSSGDAVLEPLRASRVLLRHPG